MADPAADLRDFLVGAIALVAGDDVFAAQFQPEATGVKDKSVWIVPTGGTRQLTMGAASNDVNTPSVLVTVRGDREKNADTRAFVETVRAAVHKATVLIGAGPATYDAVLVVEPKASQLKPDQLERQLYAFNVDMWVTGP